MKRTTVLFILFNISLIQYGQIVADHTVVDQYENIPQQYIDEVKKMLVDIAGESHSLGYRIGQNLLEILDPKFQVLTYDGTPPAYSTQYLRLGRHGSVGEAGFYTSSSAINAYKTLITNQHNTGNPYSVIGFGWCWDMTWVNSPGGGLDPVYDVHWAGSSEGGPQGNLRWGLDAGDQTLTGNSVCMDTYLNAVSQYIQHCITNGYPTKVILTTGPVDGDEASENGFQREIKHDYIRAYTLSNSSYLFDYADILCWSNAGAEYITNWNDAGTLRPHANIHPDNMMDYDASWNKISHTEDGDHIGEVGTLRLAKAMWWMLARIAGWDGGTGSTPGTWLGGTTDWNTGSNWYGGSVPTAGTDVIIQLAAQQPVISGGPLAVCNNLTISTGASCTVNASGALTVNGNLSNSGTLTILSDAGDNSGSLIVKGSSSGTVTYNRFLRPEANFGDRHFISSPVFGQTLSGFTSTNNSKIVNDGTIYQIWEYQETDGTWEIVSSYSIESGKGYNVNQTAESNGLLSFTGTVVNSATIPTTSPYKEGYTDRSTPEAYGVNNTGADIWAPGRSWVLYGGGGWNLLGNPFTSAMNASAFISANSVPLNKFDPNYQALYVYDGRTNVYKYAAAEIPGPTFDEGGFFGENIQAGQGFFVLALYNNLFFNFTPAMQVHNTGVTLLKSAATEEAWPGLQLKVKYGEKESSTIIVYNENMTTGLDPGYDVGQMSTGPDVEIYTSLVLKDNSVNFARQALPLADCNKIIVPVGIDSEKGGTVTFSAFVVPLDNYRFWLEDRSTGVFTDLNNTTYIVTLPANTYGTGRFFIYASVNTPTGIDSPAVDHSQDIRIWNSDDKVIIKGNVSARAIFEVYDLQGQKVMVTNLTDGELNIVDLISVTHGVYLVRIVDGMKVHTRKVVLL